VQIIEVITAACGMVAAIATLLLVWRKGGGMTKLTIQFSGGSTGLCMNGF
jgi:hypothetical protein